MEFPYEKIVKLAERIGNMRDKKYKNNLKQIKKIIEEHNTNISMTKNNNGYFLPDFESYSYETYVELTKYFEKLDMLDMLDMNENNSDIFSETNTIKKSTHFSEKNFSEHNQNKKLKYTNSETHILNKIKYENALKKHQSECEEEKINQNSENLKIKELAKIFKKPEFKNDDNLPKNAEKIFKKQQKTKEK